MMTFIDDYRKILKRRIKNYNWDNIQSEIDSFFEIVQKVTTPDNSTRCLEKFLLSPSDILAKFYLNEKRVKDIIYLDRIYEMLKYIKEINFCFPNNWNTHSYHHHNHGYSLKNLLKAVENEVEDIIHFKAEKFDLLVERPQEFKIQENFIDINFADYGLEYYEPYAKLINGIAYHLDFFMTLPYLLRSLFENILQDIFSQSLDKSCSNLYYNKRSKRYYDFSKLIVLLDQLKEQEFGPYVSGKITKDTIKELDIIREKGNISIHDIGEKITPVYANNIKDRIKITLNPLLIAFKLLKGKEIPVERRRKYKIKVRMGLIKENKKNKNSNSKREEQLKDISSSEISIIMSKIRLLIDESDLRDNRLNIRSKMDELLLAVKSLNLKNKKIEALRKMYILFNSALETYPPLKLTLQTLFDTINIIIL
jgi:hypothetical protein